MDSHTFRRLQIKARFPLLRPPLSQAYNLKQAVKASIRILAFHPWLEGGGWLGPGTVQAEYVFGVVMFQSEYADRFYAPAAPQLRAQAADKRFFTGDKTRNNRSRGRRYRSTPSPLYLPLPLFHAIHYFTETGCPLLFGHPLS